jgi:hypothetical protein
VTLGILWLAINNYLNSGYAFVGERNNANHGLTDDDERKIGEALSRSMKVENWKSRYRAIVWDDTTNLVVWGPEIGTLNVVEKSQEGKPMVVRASVSCSKENYVWDAHIRKVGEKWVVTKQP